MRLAQVFAAKLQRKSESVEKARAEFNYRSIREQVPRGCKVLDVGAWSCYLGELLRDRLGCEVLSLDVLHHAPDDQPLLDEAGRVLRDGGCLLIAEDCVDGLWNRALAVGFHIWLWMATGMTCHGRFRTTGQWLEHLHAARLLIKETVYLGHHLGRRLWPNNVLFVLRKDISRGEAR